MKLQRGTGNHQSGTEGENGYSESFMSRFQDELLNLEVFASKREAEVLIERYRNEYNHERLHRSLGYLTPAEFVEQQPSLAVGRPSS